MTMFGWTTIISKIGVPALFVLGGVVAGVGLQQRVLSAKPVPCPQCPPAPACICPPQTAVSVQPFDVQKIKNLKAFTYQPEYHGVITVAGVDSTVIRKYVTSAVDRAFNEYKKQLAPVEQS